MGVGVETLQWFAIVLMASAALSVFVALTSALQERRYDLALLRTLGARPAALAALTLAEGVTLLRGRRYTGLRSRAWRGARAGMVARRGRHRGRSPGSRGRPARRCSPRLFSRIGALTCLVPALQAYLSDPASLLAKR